MDSRSGARTAPPIFVLLCWTFGSFLRPSGPGRAWQMQLEVAQVRLSFGMGDQPVRERTALFDFGQMLKISAWR